MLRPQAPKAPYRMAAVEQGDIVKSVSASGSLEALVTVTVGSQISGLISKVLVDFNDPVKTGQVLAVIDPQTYDSRVRQGAAAVGSSQAALRQAEAQAEVARANLARTRSLFDKGITAQAALDADEATYKAAMANAASARAGIGQARAALAGNQIDLTRTKILSPIDGVVIDRKIEPGQTVAASLQAPELFVIAQDLSKLQVKINVDEADIGQVQEGQQVKFTVDAFPDDSFTGRVTQVRKQPTTTANVVAYIVIAEADNPGGRLLPGMTANADIVIDQRRGVLKVPVAALRWTPPTAAAVPTGGPPGMGGAPRPQGGSGGGGGARILNQLDLTPDQRKKADALFAEVRAKAAASGSADPTERRKAMREATQGALKQLEPILTAEQKNKLIALRAQLQAGGGRRGGMTGGAVWVLREGKPTPVPVRVGATDGSFTEIVGPLKVGDQLIVGGGPKPKAKAAGSPLGGAQVRVRT